jgi:hypothetical protein
MDRIRLLGALVLLVLVQAPLILSLDCNAISQANYQTCMEILNSNLTQIEKEAIISNLEYGKKFYPDHQFVYDRNTNLKIESAPIGVQNYNGIFVRSVWMSIFTIMPSVLYNNSFYVPNKTKVLTGFNYYIQTPSNYYSPGYPNTNDGDCKRIYTLTKNISENKVYVNNNYQGSGKLVEVDINRDSEIKANYIINVAYSIDHYYWQRYCSRYKGGRCKQYSYRCQYNYNEVKSDSIPINDYLNVRFYNNSLIGYVKTINTYSGTTKFEPNYSNSFELSFQDSQFKFNQFIYAINYSKDPYFVYTLKAEDYNQEKINNILKDGKYILVKNTNNCTIKAFDFFNFFERTCFIESKNISFYIKTDKLSYIQNETIKVSVYPQNLSVNLTYANKTKEVLGNTSLKAEFLQNKLTAKYENYETQRIINVFDQNRFALIWKFFIFGILNYLLYVILKKYLGGLI